MQQPCGMAEARTRPPDQRVAAARILIVDDSDRIRQGLHGLFELADDMRVVGEAVNGAQAVAVAAELGPDVVVMDVGMPVMDGIEATRLIHRARPSTRVVLVTALPGQEEAARGAGADALLFKDADPQELLGIIRSLTLGGAADR
jgi:DNA-binding NarL/FixJ family response regulator